jgi:single-strand DNA-binding protein
MAYDLNQINIIGRVGRDPERKQSGDSELSVFSVAVGSTLKGVAHTEWFEVVAFGKLATTCNEYLSKGQQVFLSGRLLSKQWTDKEGKERTTIQINASTMQLLQRPKGSDNDTRQINQPVSIADMAEDIPY